MCKIQVAGSVVDAVRLLRDRRPRTDARAGCITKIALRLCHHGAKS